MFLNPSAANYISRCIHQCFWSILFFERYIEEYPHIMRKVCHSAMYTSTVSKGDILFNVGEIPVRPKMLIVSHGRLRYTAVTGMRTIVSDTQWVSEALLWLHWVHRGVLVAMSDSQLCVIDAKEFQAIVCSFEHIH